MNITVIIPVYQNSEQFLHNLKKNLSYISSCEIVIVNDYPKDRELRALVKKICPQCMYVQNSKNIGFGSSVNVGVALASKPFVMLLNSDVLLSDTSFTYALKKFKRDAHLFAVSFAQKEKNGSIVGANTGRFTEGLFVHSAKSCAKECFTLWPEGGSCMFRKKIYEQLGGYDSLYSPFYWEDVDLGYRAWKNSYRCLFMPSILVEHHHETTIRRYFSGTHIRFIAQRNQLLFVWKNMDRKNVLHHVLLLPLYMFRALFHNLLFFFSLIAALSKLSSVMMIRKSMIKNNQLTDEKIEKNIT